ncbi:MAG: tetratricopeptide repeat protein [Bacteroidota bacterium]
MKYLIALLLLFHFSFIQLTGQANPSPEERIYREALEHIAIYQFEEALKLLSECYIKDQDNVSYINKIAYCHTQQGRYPDAKLYYKNALKIDSTNITALSSLGSLLQREHNYSQALTYVQKLIQLDSTNSYYYKQAAYLYSKTGDMFTGIRSFLKAHQLNPRDIETINQLSNIYLKTDNLEYAEEMIRKGLHTDPNNIKILQNKARLHKRKSEHEGVIEAVGRTMILGDTTDYYQMIVGVAYLYLDSLDQTIFHLNELIKREKDSEHTHHYLGIAYHKMDSLERSIEHFETAIQKGISEKIDIYYSDLGSIYEEQKDYKAAIQHYEKAYEYSAAAETLFFLARNHDLYYKDKKMAMRYYQKYWNTGDLKYRKYTKERIERLKEVIHFQGR